MTSARRLTDRGIQEARAYINRLRDEPERAAAPPEDLLFDPASAQPFSGAPKTHHFPITTRRDAAEYLVALDPPLDRRFVDDWRFWGWMGLYHLGDILHSPERRAGMSKATESFVIDPSDTWSLRMGYRNYLWSAWRLEATLGDNAAFLLDRNIMGIEDLMRQIVDSPRIFNSVGVPQLILRLYTRGTGYKRGHTNRPGGLRHLLRVLPQLERTYDVYGMSPDALLQILPPEFREWDRM